jgi:transcriptional regulator with XRE-family HTH domain
MQKSLFSKQHRSLVALLREARQQANLTQVDVAQRLQATQSFVSKCERGERRLDVLELRAWCKALDLSLAEFLRLLEPRLLLLDKGR